MKIKIWRYLLFSALFLSFSACKEPVLYDHDLLTKDPDPLTKSVQSFCDNLLAEPIQNEYILYFKDSILLESDIKKPVSTSEIEAVIAELEEEGDTPIKHCMCNNMVLMQTPAVDLQERVLGAESKLGPSGHRIGVVGSNYPIIFGPASDHPNEIFDVFSSTRELTPRDKKVIVAIVDTGFDLNQNDLQNYLWNNPDEMDNIDCITSDLNGVNIITHTGNSFLSDGHGTAVAGKVAGLPLNPNNPNSGYPENIDLQLMDVKFTHHDQATLFDAVCGMRYAINQGANVIVDSWGLYKTERDPLLEEVLLLAKKKMVTVVAAAGNHTNDNDVECSFYPARFAEISGFENVISVGAADPITQSLASFSNFGKSSVLLVADGVQEPAISPNGQANKKVDGTSIAAPIVARTISIIKANNPTISHLNLRDCLLQNTLSDPNFQTIKNGLLDADGSILSCQ